jgi:hypothetical protein
LFDLVIHRTGQLVEAGLPIDEARAKARDWNSRAATENWVTWEAHRPERETPDEPAAGYVPPVNGNAKDPLFEPTPEEIRSACQTIQAGWDLAEKYRRAMTEELRERLRDELIAVGQIIWCPAWNGKVVRSC